jgi:hypothetical protein
VLGAESLLRPLPIALDDNVLRFSFSLAGAGTIGEGVGRGNAALLLSGTRVEGSFITRGVPMGARLFGIVLAVIIGLPQPAVLGRGFAASNQPDRPDPSMYSPPNASSEAEGFGHIDFCVSDGAGSVACFCLASYSAGLVKLILISLNSPYCTVLTQFPYHLL